MLNFVSGGSCQLKPYVVDYRVFRQTGSNDVYLYEEKYSGVKFLGKFFLTARQPNREKAAIRMEREFHHLHFMRSLGFNHSELDFDTISKNFYSCGPVGSVMD